MDVRPNNTIYINNLNEKIKKDGKYLYYINCFHSSWLYIVPSRISS